MSETEQFSYKVSDFEDYDQQPIWRDRGQFWQGFRTVETTYYLETLKTVSTSRNLALAFMFKLVPCHIFAFAGTYACKTWPLSSNLARITQALEWVTIKNDVKYDSDTGILTGTNNPVFRKRHCLKWKWSQCLTFSGRHTLGTTDGWRARIQRRMNRKTLSRNLRAELCITIGRWKHLRIKDDAVTDILHVARLQDMWTDIFICGKNTEIIVCSSEEFKHTFYSQSSWLILDDF